jgi:hypothetical protein
MTTARLFRLFAAAVVVSAALIPGPAQASANVTEVAHGLDSPRGVAFFHGRLVVGEAGHGGHGGPACVTPPNGPGEICVGLTSQISWVNPETQLPKPLVTGLFSITLGQEGTLGVAGLSVSDGRILAILGASPQELNVIPCATAACNGLIDTAKGQAGHLISVTVKGKWRSVASVGAFDYEYTKTLPLPREIDANPYGVLASGRGAYVADAGANTLDWVNSKGAVSIVTHFQRFDPNTFPTDAVPDCVARADGALWVADLSGRLFRIQDGTATQVPMPLLTHVTGCTADQEGNLYLVNMWDSPPPSLPSPFSGSVVKFDTEEGQSSVVAAHLNFPNMDTIGPDGNLYVSAGSICPAGGIPGLCPRGGTVLRISLDSENHQA